MPDDELDELRRRLKNDEDALVERKPTVKDNNIRPAVVAFANSLQPGTTGVLFLGVTDGGDPTRDLGDADAAQRSAGQHIGGCVPPIPHRIRALKIDNADVLAVVVMPSESKPHFTGKAYVRRNNETKEASDDMLDKLVADRLSLVRALTPSIGGRISYQKQKEFGTACNRTWQGNQQQADLVAVNGHYLTIRESELAPHLSFALKRVMLEFDHQNQRPLLRIALD